MNEAPGWRGVGGRAVTDSSLRENQDQPLLLENLAQGRGTLRAEGLTGKGPTASIPVVGEGATPAACLLVRRRGTHRDCEDSGRLPAWPLGCWTHARALVHGHPRP